VLAAAAVLPAVAAAAAAVVVPVAAAAGTKVEVAASLQATHCEARVGLSP
jgi:hypothetical protein